MVHYLAWIVFLFAAAAVAQPSSEDLRNQLCERALQMGGPLEEYLAGVGVEDPAAVARARALLERLAQSHPELPESYVKLAVLMAAEDGATVSAEAAEATLGALAGCRGEPVTEEAVEEPVDEPAPPAIGNPRKTFLEGVALADRGAVEEAEAVFRSLIATYPQLPEPYVNLAALLFAGGDEGGASRMAESALLAHPVCRAAFDLEMLRDFGDFSRSLVADLGRSASRRSADRRSANRVVGPDWIPSAGEHLEEIGAIAVTLKAWLVAWSERRIDDYLGFYAEDFRPVEGDGRIWRAERRSGFAGSQPVELEISDLDVDVSSPVAGTAAFTLRSRSGGAGITVVVEKHLEFEKVGDAWRIVAERPGG
ncbi:MAG: hypothetical protein V3T72_06165 [Thermoanaerobaculia bacterium]